MQENSFELRQSFVNGLKKYPSPAVNVPYLDRCENLIPGGSFLESPKPIARPGAFATEPKEHPFPAAFKGDKIRLLFGDTNVKTLDADFVASSALALNTRAVGTAEILRGGPWHCETFMEYWFATNGESLVYNVPSDDGDVYVASGLLAQAVGRYNYRVVLGGLSGSWLAGSRWLELFETWKETSQAQSVVYDGLAADTTWAIYSESGGGATDLPFHSLCCACGLFGDAAFDDAKEIIWDSIERGDIGLIPVRKVSNIRAMKQLGSRLIVYGDHSISEISATEAGFQETLVCDFGIGGRACVGGNEKRHVFLDSQGVLYSFYANQDTPERQEYGMWFEDFQLVQTTICHNPNRDEYWITDGWTCYVLTKFGLGGPMTTRPTSMFVDGTYGLVGVYKTPNTEEWSIQTAAFDVSERDFKHLVCVHLHGNGYSDATARAYGTYRNGDAVQKTPETILNHEGVAYMPLSFLEGYISIQGNGTEVDLTTVEIRYQGEGKRHRRGTSGQPSGD